MSNPANHLGVITTPKQGNAIPENVPVIADNGRFGNGWVGYGKWITFLEKLTPIADRVVFATAPDVFNPDLGSELGAVSTAESLPWLPVIRQLGLPAALVAQNGLTRDMVPWNQLDVLFLGGCMECVPCGWIPAIADLQRMAEAKSYTCPRCGRQLVEWKLSAAAHALTREALARGKAVHMARVSSFERALAAHHRGCQTMDGTYITYAPDKNLPKVLAWLREINQQHELFGEAA